MADNDNLKDILGGVGKLTPFKQSQQHLNWGGETYLSAGDWDVKTAVDPLLANMNKAMGKTGDGGDVCPEGYIMKEGKCVKKEKEDGKPDDKPDVKPDDTIKKSEFGDCDESLRGQYLDCISNCPDCWVDCECTPEDDTSGAVEEDTPEGDCEKVLMVGDTEDDTCYDTCLEECPEGGSHYNPLTDKFGDGAKDICEDKPEPEPEPEPKPGPEPGPEPEPGPVDPGFIVNPDDDVDPVDPDINTNIKDGVMDISGGGSGYTNQTDLFNDKSIPTGTEITGMNSFTEGQVQLGDRTFTGGTIKKIDGGVVEEGTVHRNLKGRKDGSTVPLSTSTSWVENPNSQQITRTRTNQTYHTSFNKKYLGRNNKLTRDAEKENKTQLERKERGKGYFQYEVVEDSNGNSQVVKTVYSVTTKSPENWKNKRVSEQANYDAFVSFVEADKSGEECIQWTGESKIGKIGNMKSYDVTAKNNQYCGADKRAILQRANAFLSRSNYFPSMEDTDESALNYLETPVKFRSPFHQEKVQTITRENWMPSNITTQSPMNYGSPFHEEVGVGENIEQNVGEQENPDAGLWNLYSQYNGEIEKKLMNYNFEKFISGQPAKAIYSSKAIGKFTEFLANIKTEIVDAIKNKDKEGRAKAEAKVQTFIQEATITIPNKYLMWVDSVAGSEDPANKGGSILSSGNHKIKSMVDNLFFMGSDLSEELQPNVDVAEDGRIAIKMGGEGLDYNADAIWSSDLGNTFPVDALGIQSFLDFAGQNEQDAIAGKKVNATKNQGIAKTLIKNTSTALSVMFDNWYGESLFDSLPENAKLEEWMHPESPNFDEERVRSEAIGFLAYKLDEIHNNALPPVEESVDVMSPEEILNKYS